MLAPHARLWDPWFDVAYAPARQSGPAYVRGIPAATWTGATTAQDAPEVGVDTATT